MTRVHSTYKIVRTIANIVKMNTVLEEHVAFNKPCIGCII